MNVAHFIKCAPFIPEITITELEYAVPLACAVSSGGAKSILVYLNGPLAFEAITLLKSTLPNTYIGASNLTKIEHFTQVKRAGADFATSAGITKAMTDSAQVTDLPYLPGIFTPSEMLAAKDLGFHTQHFFPAEIAGGINLLKTYYRISPEIKFCVSGNITTKNMRDYLALPNVLSVSGNWLTPHNLIQEKNWEGIASLTRQCVITP